jgi:hypothetical protein
MILFGGFISDYVIFFCEWNIIVYLVDIYKIFLGIE